MKKSSLIRILVCFMGALVATAFGYWIWTFPPPAKPKRPVFAEVTYDKVQDCAIIDLAPGRKYLGFGFTSPAVGAAARHYFATRAMREDETAGPEIVIISPQLGDNKTECAYIVREHALPAPSTNR